MVPSLLENFNRRTRKTAHQKGGNDMVFSEHEAICHLAVALRMDTKRVEDDLLFVAFSAREFVGLDALRQSAHIYAAFVTRFLVLYKKLGQNKNLAMIEIERECVTIFGTNGVQLCEDFLVKFLSSTSELPLGEWERITKETLVVVESYNRTLLEFSLSLHRGLLQKRHAGMRTQRVSAVKNAAMTRRLKTVRSNAPPDTMSARGIFLEKQKLFLLFLSVYQEGERGESPPPQRIATPSRKTAR